MTNQNNDSKTSGEAALVPVAWQRRSRVRGTQQWGTWLENSGEWNSGEWYDHLEYETRALVTREQAAETIKRLVAERDAALEEERITRSKFEYRLTAEHDRAEAAEKRIAELKVTLNRVSADRDRWYKAARLLEAERAHSEAAKGVNTQYAWAMFHLGLSDDDDPEEFGRQLSDKIDGLEADLQQAMEALELAARYLEYGGFDMTKIDAALKGKQP